MINYYQPFLLPFLGLDRSGPPPHIRRYYYHSFEDGLWDFLEQHAQRIPLGSVFLIPDFYCIDVINNIVAHGYICVLYPLNEHFQADEAEVIRIAKKTHARVLVVFHACGITSEILTTHLFERLPEEVVVLEDSVHRLVNPSSVRLLHDNHLLMDSLRKVTPLPGSFMYATPRLIDSPQTNRWFTWYTVVAWARFIAFRCVFTLAMLLRISALVVWAHDSLLQSHDDLIGDSVHGHRGLPFIPYMYDHINFAKVARMKMGQVRLYDELFTPLIRRHKNMLYKVAINEDDYRTLRVYPLGFKAQPDEKLIDYLHEHDIIVWFEFYDAPWSKNRSVLFLPLGFHITSKDISFITETLEQYLV